MIVYPKIVLIIKNHLLDTIIVQKYLYNIQYGLKIDKIVIKI